MGLSRFIATARVTKHRFFVFLDATVLSDTRLNAIARADDTTLSLLNSRIHEVWSLAQALMHGVENDPTCNAKYCFKTFPFPIGLTPAYWLSSTTSVQPGSSPPWLPSTAGLTTCLQCLMKRSSSGCWF